MGPPIKYVQGSKPSCLVCSIALALEYIQEGIIAKRLIAHYETFENDESKQAFTMNDVLAVTMYNKGRAKNERRTIVQNNWHTELLCNQEILDEYFEYWNKCGICDMLRVVDANV